MNARYAVESQSVPSRRVTKVIKIRTKLGQTKGGIIAHFPGMPKGMHEKTYERIRADALEEEKRIWEDTKKWLKL